MKTKNRQRSGREPRANAARRLAVALVAVAFSSMTPAARAQERDFDEYPEPVRAYLKKLYAPERRQFAFRPDDPGGIEAWQREARAALRALLGLDRIRADAADHVPVVELEDEEEDLGDCLRRRGVIETEPQVRIRFWLLRPKGNGPWPMGLFPHGHDSRGHDTSAGVFHDEAHREHSVNQDRDVALQAARRGYFAIAPAVRGLAAGGVPDLHDRHGKSDCRSQMIHCLLAGRTATGERVWDLERLIDWASTQPGVDAGQVLLMGNSGGGTLTLYAAACDPRVTVAVPSCAFSPLTSESGYIFHCDCNLVPDIMNWGDLTDVAGLIAPRHLLIVHGHGDKIFSEPVIEAGYRRAREIFSAQDAADRVELRWGDDGHRYYRDLMWPFIHRAEMRPPLRGLSRTRLLEFRDASGTVRTAVCAEEWEARRREALAGFQEVAGRLPGAAMRCPLEMKTLEEADCGSYLRRLIEYQSSPGGRVPAYLCLPKAAQADKPAPAVLCLHPTDNIIGHGVVVGLGGKPNRQYAAELAERGFVTLAPAYPLLAQYQPDLAELGFSSGTMKAIWDNLRGLDLLETLPMVRKEAGFAIIGHSLGGHNGIFTAVFDERVQVVATSCGFDSLLDYKGGNIQGWVQERYMLGMGDYLGRPQDAPFDFYELIACLAPRWVFVNAPLRDSNFHWASVERIAAAALPVFALHGAGNRIEIHHPDSDHDFPDKERFAAYDLIERILGSPPKETAQSHARSQLPR